MGKQSSRIYFQGQDHKDIWFQGKYHNAMYIGNQLVWKKIYDYMIPYIGIFDIWNQSYQQDFRYAGYGKLETKSKRTNFERQAGIDEYGFYPYISTENYFISFSGSSGGYDFGREILITKDGEKLNSYKLFDKAKYWGGNYSITDNMIGISIINIGSEISKGTFFFTIDKDLNIKKIEIEDEIENKYVEFCKSYNENKKVLVFMHPNGEKYCFYKNGKKVGEDAFNGKNNWKNFYSNSKYMYVFWTETINEKVQRCVKIFDIENESFSTKYYEIENNYNNYIFASIVKSIYQNDYFYIYANDDYNGYFTIYKTNNFVDFQKIKSLKKDSYITFDQVNYSQDQVKLQISNVIDMLSGGYNIEFSVENGKIKRNGNMFMQNYKYLFNLDNIFFEESNGNFCTQVDYYS